MTTKHTPGPWVVHADDLVCGANDRRVADCEHTLYKDRPAPANPEDIANARRIVACVNACEGADCFRAELEKVRAEVTAAYKQSEQQRRK